MSYVKKSTKTTLTVFTYFLFVCLEYVQTEHKDRNYEPRYDENYYDVAKDHNDDDNLQTVDVNTTLITNYTNRNQLNFNAGVFENSSLDNSIINSENNDGEVNNKIGQTFTAHDSLINDNLEHDIDLHSTASQYYSICKNTTSRYEDVRESIEFNELDSIHLNNIYTRTTTNLIEEKVTTDQIKNNGASLNELIDDECGGIKKCTVNVENWKSNDTLTIGFLGAYGSSQTVLGALPLAVEAVNRDPALLPGIRLRFVAADIGGPIRRTRVDRDSLPLRAMTQMRDLGVVAFFGPDGSCHSEAKLAAAWNLPIISHKCAGSARDRSRKRSLGATFARTLPPAHMVSKSVVALLKAFKWNKFVLVAGDVPASAGQQMEAIKELAQDNGMIVTAERRFADYIPRHIATMERIVEETYRTTRVYVFLGEHIALVDMVRLLHRRRLLANGQYAVIAVDDEIFDPSNARITQTDHLDPFLNISEDLFAFRSVLKLTPSYPSNPNYHELCEMVRSLSASPPFCVPNYHRIFDSISVPIEAAHLYDAVTMWARAATAVTRAGISPFDGAAIMRLLRPTTYRSVQGFDVYMDAAGDSEGNFTVIGLVQDTKALGGWAARPVAAFRYASPVDPLPELVGGEEIQWVGGSPPVAEPECGFTGAACELQHDPRMLAAAVAVAAAALLGAALLLRHYCYEQKLASLLWRIDSKDLLIIPSLSANTATEDILDKGCGVESEARRAHTTVGIYRGNIVAVKKLHKKSIDVTRAIRKEMKQIRELRHENLNAFVGACVESGSAYIVSAYCARGSLARVLADRDLHLDDMFVASLVADLLRGLAYLHDSTLISHGNLTSSNCLVDSRWVLQISDYGLHHLKSGCADAEGALRAERRMLWRAPELLRDSMAPLRGSQKGDVYSFAIILYEILGRQGPWGDTGLSNAEIIGRVRHPIDDVWFRPPLANLRARASVLSVLRACWHEQPERRPDVRLVKIKLKDMHAGMKTNIFDNMLAMMEKYAYNLETLVAARTEQLTQEKRRTDDLLHRMLPRTVAEALKRGERVQAESFESVTVYFSDIVGFTRLAATSTPMQVVEILNDLYTCCDSIISNYDVYKVETIGDAYMVVSGLPVRNERHAGEVASLALHVLDAVPQIRVRHQPCSKLQIRVGVHSGRCAAGVVGVTMPRYCLFGDTVNVAARMESSGEPQRIHISNDTYKLLTKLGGYRCSERGLINIKGKGEMRTWWLVGEDRERRKSPLTSESSQSSRTRWRTCIQERGVEELRERARLSCGAASGPAPWRVNSSSSSPGRSAVPCACFVPHRDHCSAPAVTFCIEDA